MILNFFFGRVRVCGIADKHLGVGGGRKGYEGRSTFPDLKKKVA